MLGNINLVLAIYVDTQVIGLHATKGIHVYCWPVVFIFNIVFLFFVIVLL